MLFSAGAREAVPRGGGASCPPGRAWAAGGGMEATPWALRAPLVPARAGVCLGGSVAAVVMRVTLCQWFS